MVDLLKARKGSILGRIDSWYATRAKTHITEEIKAEYQRLILEALNAAGEDDLAESHSDRSPNLEDRFQDNEYWFSELYFSFDWMMKDRPIEGTTIQEIAGPLYNEYIAPLFEHVSRLKVFVDKVRDYAAEKTAEPISDAEIDGLFVETFPDPAEFGDILAGMFTGLALWLEVFHRMGEGTAEEISHYRSVMKGTPGAEPYLANAMFGDLYE